MLNTLHAKLLHPNIIIGIGAVAALLAVAGTYVLTAPKSGGSYVNPTRGAIVQEVDASGAVKAADSVDLSFQTSGRISSVSATVGSHVGRGTVLASVDSSDARAALAQAQAALQVQQAKLDSLKAGSRPESIAVAQTAVTGAQSSLSQATANLLSAVQSAYITADGAVHNTTDPMFNNPRSVTPTLSVTLSDSQAQANIVTDRVAVEQILTQWQTALNALPAGASQDQIVSVATLSQTDLVRVQSYLDELANGLTHAIPTTSVPQSTVSAYQSDAATARVAVAGAVSSVNTAQTAQTAAQNALSNAQSALTLAQAPATAQDTEAQTAQVAAAQANVDAAQAQLNKTVIVAPFSGTITVNNAHLGATAAPGSPLISMISDAQFQFETYVSQTDFAKISVGNEAQISLDAYQGAASLPAHVIAVDPAATVQNGVASYKITLEFDNMDSQIKAGLTGNAHIVTQTEQNVLSVPTSAIITRGTDTYVLVQSGSGDQLTKVEIGIESTSGQTEVRSGITEQDKVKSFGNAQ